MYNTAELIEAKFLEKIAKLEEAASLMGEAASSKNPFALIVEVTIESEDLKILKIEGDWSLEKFGKALLQKFPEHRVETKKLVEDKIWKRFRKEVSTVSTNDEAATKKALRGSGATYFWYPDLLEWHVSCPGKAAPKKLSEVA